MSSRINGTMLVMVLSLLLATSIASGAEPVKIAHFEIMSGPYQSVGEYYVETLKWMSEWINKKGGVLGRPIEVKSIDHEFKPDVLTRKAKEIIASDKPHFLLHFSSSSLALALSAIAEKSKVIYVAGAAETDELTGEKGHPYIFRTCATALIRAKAVAEFLKKNSKYKKIALLNPDYSYGYSMNAAAKKYIGVTRPDIQFLEILNPIGTKDYGPYMTKMKDWGADLVLTGNYGPDLARIVQAASEFGLPAKFLTYYVHDVSVLNVVGKAGLGHFVLGPEPFVNPQRPAKWESFLLEYNKAHKNLSGQMQWPAVFGQTALLFILAGLEKAGKVDTEAFIKAAEGFTFEGVNGPVYIRACDHQADQKMFVRTIAMGNKYMPNQVADGEPIDVIPAEAIQLTAGESGNQRCKK